MLISSLRTRRFWILEPSGPKTPPELFEVSFFMIFEGFWHLFKPPFEGFSMTLGIASYIKFWYSPKSPDTRNTAELLQRSLWETSKEENWQETCRELARTLQEMQRTFRALASNQPTAKYQNHTRRIAFFDAIATATNAELQNRGRRYSRRMAH